MKFLSNRIVISLIVIAVLAYVWEFEVRPQTGPLYAAAVNEYKAGNHERSLQLLNSAYDIDPNDASTLALLGWNYLKVNKPETAEPYFERAHRLSPDVDDITLGLAYTKLALEKDADAAQLLAELSQKQKGASYEDVNVARGTLNRTLGKNREAAEEFRIVLARDSENPVALKNLREIYDLPGDATQFQFEFPPLERPAQLTYHTRAAGDSFSLQGPGGMKPALLMGVNLTPSLPGRFPAEPGTDPKLYPQWLRQISDMGANAIRVYSLLPPGFYRALAEFNQAAPQRPLWLLQGVAFSDPPAEGDFFQPGYYEACQKEIHDTLDALHGQGSVAGGTLHPGGIYLSNVAPWVAGLVVGRYWDSHQVLENDRLHPERKSYRGTYLEVPNGTATEIFLAEMLDYTAKYEEDRYNWQHPVAFLSWPTLDPMRHPTESTLLEEIGIRRSLGEQIPTPPPPYDNDDEATVNPTHLRALDKLAAGYFAAYNVSPFYPDFMNYDPVYQRARDAEGPNPFYGYLLDLKANHRGLPLLVVEYGVPSSLGIGHFNPAGFNEGGLTEAQQGRLLARFTRNVVESGAAGGLVFEWLSQWYRRSWLVRDYETPFARNPLWTNFMDPAEYFGLVATDPQGQGPRAHRLTGEATEWGAAEPWHGEEKPGQVQPVGDAFDPARNLKALYVDADEGFLYLRLVVEKLDTNNDGQPDWRQVNYLIGIGTAPEQAGLTYLPFIAPVRFRPGMTYALQLAGPSASRLSIASTYNPFEVAQVEGLPAQTTLQPRLGWRATLSDTGSFEAQIIEPNRRRFGRDGRYFPPQRYERGLLRSGSLDPAASNYDSLATWNANLKTNTIDLRIPWNLLNITDPSSHQAVAGLQRDGTVETMDTVGLNVVVFSYQPREALLMRPIMEQGHPIADSLPGMESATAMSNEALRPYRWVGWNVPRYQLRLKASYEILRQALRSLPAAPSAAATPRPPATPRRSPGAR